MSETTAAGSRCNLTNADPFSFDIAGLSRQTVTFHSVQSVQGGQGNVGPFCFHNGALGEDLQTATSKLTAIKIEGHCGRADRSLRRQRGTSPKNTCILTKVPEGSVQTSAANATRLNVARASRAQFTEASIPAKLYHPRLCDPISQISHRFLIDTLMPVLYKARDFNESPDVSRN